MVSARLEIDILPIPSLLLVQRPLKKEQDCSTKVFIRVAISITWHLPCCIDRLREVLAEPLLPSSPVLSLEHILELRKGVNPCEFAFLCPLVELGDRLIGGELDGLFPVKRLDLLFPRTALC